MSENVICIEFECKLKPTSDWFCMEASKSLTEGSFGSTPGSCTRASLFSDTRREQTSHDFEWTSKEEYEMISRTYSCKNGRYKWLIRQQFAHIISFFGAILNRQLKSCKNQRMPEVSWKNYISNAGVTIAFSNIIEIAYQLLCHLAEWVKAPSLQFLTAWSIHCI